MNNISVFLLFCFSSFILSSLCWGQDGHKIITQIAWNRCTSKTQQQLKLFLGTKSLVDICGIPDDYAHSAGGTWSAPMHYINVKETSKTFNLNDCGKFCVIEAVKNYTTRLQAESKKPIVQCPTPNTGKEPCSLEFLVHFEEDITQPLHCGYLEDRGGNSVNVYWLDTRTQSNLHSVWDTKMIQKRWSSNLQKAVTELEQKIKTEPQVVQKLESNLDPFLIGTESFEIVLDSVYHWDHEQNGRPLLDEAYYNKNIIFVETRLIASAIRLSKLLNTMFDSEFSNNSTSTNLRLLSRQRRHI